ncbi:helix-turn-helix transcriptional regulator [Saccharothrix violaceirubra]|uniref:Transcriptional regulator with XRE-family HTH domain n=1 Tax=Saccharothrix violaceirubra TaxID=413306 RepID=A0A7W7T1R2_9PSEU|nr:helix-turn-helix transcriptional regulator [Saccharothrix violaceirubra]MBB4964948.1 transcriptional regulator with XRE-family HTH domain [Saccharothrix violaceirubra]
MDELDGVSATLATRRLGLTLRALRGRITTLRVADVAKAAGLSQPTWSQVETGVAIPSSEHLAAAAKILEATDEEVATLLALRERAKRREWWHEYNDITSPNLSKLIGYETSAIDTKMCAGGWVPGLLQTPDWARAAINVAGAKTRPEDVERAVELRMRRQAVLDNPRARLHAICGEESIRYRAGGWDVQTTQLRHLLEVGEAENITVQILPFTAGLHIGHSQPYSIFEFGEFDPPIVHQEDLVEVTLTDNPAEVRRCKYAFGVLEGLALSVENSRKLIESILKE